MWGATSAHVQHILYFRRRQWQRMVGERKDSVRITQKPMQETHWMCFQSHGVSYIAIIKIKYMTPYFLFKKRFVNVAALCSLLIWLLTSLGGCWLIEWHGTSNLTSPCLVQEITFSVWFKLIQLCERYWVCVCKALRGEIVTIVIINKYIV